MDSSRVSTNAAQNELSEQLRALHRYGEVAPYPETKGGQLTWWAGANLIKQNIKRLMKKHAPHLNEQDRGYFNMVLRSHMRAAE